MDLSGYTSISQTSDQALPLLKLNNQFGSCDISLFGGHLTSYIPCDGRERLWMSPAAIKDGVKPLRGGIPVCWPWFSDNHGMAPGELPSHGYLRNQIWALVKAEESAKGTSITLSPSTTLGPGLSFETSVTLTVTLGECLSVALATSNHSDSTINLGCALHTYFNVTDIDNVELKGLTGNFKDKTKDFALIDTPVRYQISQETDRIHLQAAPTVDIEFDDKVTSVGSDGHDSIVVWNPWESLSRSMADMTDDGYRHMVCVETALTQGYELLPGRTHVLTQTIA